MSYDNEKRIAGLHPLVADRARRHIALAKENGFTIVITQGLRSMEEQAALYAKGRTAPGKIVTKAKPGHSYHNYGLAYDIAIVHYNKVTWDAKIDIDEDQVPDYTEVGMLGESLGLEWGGRWKFIDIPHFQFTFGISIKDLLRGATIPEVDYLPK